MALTTAQRRALQVLRDGPLRPREFARAMWPDSPGWQRSYNCGPNGSHRGGAMYRAGGAYLGKLRALGLVHTTNRHRWDTAYALTEAGVAALDLVYRGQA